MPLRAPRLCRCGHRVAHDARCPCEQRQDAERKARFDRQRPSSGARGYDRAWSRARAEYLREHRHCRRCGRIATVVDHKVPHRGDRTLFWDRSNWQALCAPCHDGAKQREERRGVQEGANLAMTAFTAASARLYIGGTDTGAQDWVEIAHVETIGTTRIAGGVEVVACQNNADVGQAALRAAVVGKRSRAFRAVFPDGERRFAARVVSAQERPAGGRVRVVLAITSSVERVEVRHMVEA